MHLSPSPYDHVYANSVKGPGAFGWHHSNRMTPSGGIGEPSNSKTQCSAPSHSRKLSDIHTSDQFWKLGSHIFSQQCVAGPSDVRYDES